MKAKVEIDADLSELPSSQRQNLAEPIERYIDMALTRNENIYLHCQSGGDGMKAIGDTLGLHYSSVSKIINAYGNAKFKT